MKTLMGKTAIVTGGGHGVGRGIALALAAEGANVVVCGRTAATLAAVCAEIETRGGAAAAVLCDVTVPADLERLVAATLAGFGGIDILVNNAALVPRGALLQIDADQIQGAWDTGPVAALNLMRLCHPHLCGGGAIVNVSSAAAIQAHAPDRGVYAAVKAALNALSRAAANEWGADGIRVNSIMPFARTEAVERFFANEPAYAQTVLAAVPLGRIGDCEEDIGRAVAFLAGPAAVYLTGATLPLDGGTAYLR